MTPTEFIATLRKGKAGPAYFLRGPDRFLHEECRAAIVASLPPEAREWCLAEIEYEPGRLARELEAAGQDVDVVYSSNRDLDILPADTNKGTAAEFLAQSWGIGCDRRSDGRSPVRTPERSGTPSRNGAGWWGGSPVSSRRTPTRCAPKPRAATE